MSASPEFTHFQAIYRQALTALQQKQPAEAIRLGQQLQEQASDWALTQHLLGVLALQSGQVQRTLELWQRGLQQFPAEPRLLDAQLKLLLQLQRPQEALGCFQQACEHKLSAKSLLAWSQLFLPTYPEAAMACLEAVLTAHPESVQVLEAGLALAKEQGWPERALKLAEQAAQNAPSPGRWVLLGQLYSKSGQIEAAEKAFLSALALDADHLSAHYHLGGLWVACKREAEALAHFKPVLHTVPNLGVLLLEIAQRLLGLGKYPLATEYMDLCLEIPASTGKKLHQLLLLRATCAHHLLNVSDQKRYYQAAAEAAPHRLLYAPEVLNSLPYLYHNRDEMIASRQAFEVGLGKLKRDIEQAVRKGGNPSLLAKYRRYPFLLAYQGLDDRALVADLGQFWTGFLRKHRLLREVQRGPKTGRAIRVGFVSRYFYNHSVLLCYGNLLSDVAADPDFEVSCFHLGPQIDSRSRWLKERIQHFFHVADHPQPENVILEKELDILIYTDIGMDAQTYAMAMHRLAPIQAVLSGHPVTTGLPNQDYYFSSSEAEPENAQEHYTETLLALSKGYTRYDMPVVPPTLRSRAELGLSEKQHIYLCPMTLYKLHCDYDWAIAEILRADPLAHFYIVRLRESNIHEIVLTRFRKLAPDVADRLHVLPWMSQVDFYSALIHADVVLDSFHFGAGTTIRMVLGLGKPFPSWPSEFNRGRMVLRSYVRMGLEERLPKTQQAFVAEAVRQACDADWREARSQEIIEHRQVLFGEADGLGEFKDCLRQAVALWPERLTSRHLVSLSAP